MSEIHFIYQRQEAILFFFLRVKWSFLTEKKSDFFLSFSEIQNTFLVLQEMKQFVYPSVSKKTQFFDNSLLFLKKKKKLFTEEKKEESVSSSSISLQNSFFLPQKKGTKFLLVRKGKQKFSSSSFSKKKSSWPKTIFLFFRDENKFFFHFLVSV